MPINHLYDTWIRRIRELRPGQRMTQIRNFVWLIIGVYQRPVYASEPHCRQDTRPSQVVEHHPTVEHAVGQFGHPRTRMVRAYRPGVAGNTVPAYGRNSADRQWHQDWRRSSAVDRLPGIPERAIPIAWTWVKHVRGHSTAAKQLALSAYVRQLIPLSAKHMVSAHRQFVHAPESVQRLPELALLAGSILSFLAATLPATPTGCWDRQPKRTPGRFRRTLIGKPFPKDYRFSGQLRKKASATAHLPKGYQANRLQPENFAVLRHMAINMLKQE